MNQVTAGDEFNILDRMKICIISKYENSTLSDTGTVHIYSFNIESTIHTSD